MTVLYFPEQRVGFGVDYVNVRRLPGSLGLYSFDQYASAIGTMLTLDIDTVVPGGRLAGAARERNDLGNRDTYAGELADRLRRDASPWVRAEAAEALGRARGAEARSLAETLGSVPRYLPGPVASATPGFLHRSPRRPK